MALSEEVVDEYKTSLADLNFNSKPLINMLTMLAEDHEQHAPEIVKVIEDHINKCKPDRKLPALYLMDSIMKNLEKSSYRSLFSRNIAQTFTSVFEQVDEKTRASMFKLRQTWSSILPNATLYRIDKKINSLFDPAWPITATEPEQTSIHVNPRFIQGMGSESERSSPDVADVAEDQDEQEMLIRQQLIEKQQELLRLKQARLELELAETAEKLKRKPGAKGGSNIASSTATPLGLPMPSVEEALPLPEVAAKPKDPRPRPTDPRRRDPRLQARAVSTPSSVQSSVTGPESVVAPLHGHSTLPNTGLAPVIPGSSHITFRPVSPQGPYSAGQIPPAGRMPFSEPSQAFGSLLPYNGIQGPGMPYQPMPGMPPTIPGHVFSGEVFNPEDCAKFSDENDSDSSRSSLQGQNTAKLTSQTNIRDPRHRIEHSRKKDPRFEHRPSHHDRPRHADKQVNRHSTEKQVNRHPTEKQISSVKDSQRDTKDQRFSSGREIQEKRKSKDREVHGPSKQGKESMQGSPRKSASGQQVSKHRSVSKDRESKSETKLKDTTVAERKWKDEEIKRTGTKVGAKNEDKKPEKPKGRTSRERERSPQQSSKQYSGKSRELRGAGDRKAEKKIEEKKETKPEPKNSDTAANKKGGTKAVEKKADKSKVSRTKEATSKSNVEPMDIDDRVRPKEAEKRLSSDRTIHERTAKKPKLEETVAETQGELEGKKPELPVKIKTEFNDSAMNVNIKSEFDDTAMNVKIKSEFGNNTNNIDQRINPENQDVNIKEEDMDIVSEPEATTEQDVPKIDDDISDLFGGEDEDYRPAVPKHQLPLKSPSSKGWDQFKASQPEQYAYDIELKKQRQDSVVDNTAVGSEEELQDEDLRVHQPEFQRQRSGTAADEVSIPEELAINRHTDILLEAHKKLKEGLITHEQHQELLKQLGALMQIQELQEQNRRLSSEIHQQQELEEQNHIVSPKMLPSQGQQPSSELPNKSSPPGQPEQALPDRNQAREIISPERPLETFKIPKKSVRERADEEERRKELSNLYPESPQEDRYRAHGPFPGRDNQNRHGADLQSSTQDTDERVRPFGDQPWKESKDEWRASSDNYDENGPPVNIQNQGRSPQDRFDGLPEHRGPRSEFSRSSPRENEMENFPDRRMGRPDSEVDNFDRGIGRGDGPNKFVGRRPLLDAPPDDLNSKRQPRITGPPDRFDDRRPRPEGLADDFGDRMQRPDSTQEDFNGRRPRQDGPPDDFDGRRPRPDGPQDDFEGRWPRESDYGRRGPDRFEHAPEGRGPYRNRRSDNWPDRLGKDVPPDQRSQWNRDFDGRGRDEGDRREMDEGPDFFGGPPDRFPEEDGRRPGKPGWRESRRLDKWGDQNDTEFGMIENRGPRDRYPDSRGPPGKLRDGRKTDQRGLNEPDDFPPDGRPPRDHPGRDRAGRFHDRRGNPPDDRRPWIDEEGPTDNWENGPPRRAELRKARLEGPYGRPGPPSEGSKPWLPPGQRSDSPKKELRRGHPDRNERSRSQRLGRRGDRHDEEEYEPAFIEKPKPKPLMSLLDPLPPRPPPGLRGSIRMQGLGPRGPEGFDGPGSNGPFQPQVDSYVDKFGDPRFRCFVDMGPEVSEEVVIGKRNFEIKLGAPPRRIAWGKDTIEVFADPSKRGVVVDQKLMYKFGERVKDVTIRGRKEKLFYHGRPLNLWIDGQHYEVRVDAPPKSINIDEKVHKIQIDGRDMMILIDKEEMGRYGGDPRFVFIDEERKELRFDPPPRHILIDGNPCELKLNLQQPCVNIKGVYHGIRFDGPPRDVFIDGKLYKIFTDHAVKIKVGNRYHYVALGGPCHEIIIDGKWFEMKFNEAPKEVNVGNQVLMVKLPGSPPEVKILPEIMHGPRQILPGMQGPIHPPGIMPGPGPGPMGFAGPNMGPGMPVPGVGPPGIAPMQPPGGPMQSQPGPLPGPQVNIPQSTGPSIPLSGPPMIPGIGPPVPGAPGTQPSSMPNVLSSLFPPMPATSSAATPLDINSLLDKLVTTGLIKKEESDTKPATTKAEVVKPQEYIIPQKKSQKQEEKFASIPDMTEMDTNEMKSLPVGMVQRLYAGIQCTSCGERFVLKDGEKTEKYRQHLDWHFRQNRKGKTDMKLTSCRKWYYPINDWMQYEEVTDSKDTGKSNFFEQQQQQQQQQPVESTPTKNPLTVVVPEGVSAIKCPAATGNDDEDMCNICHEVFEQYWDEELEEWHLRDAIKVGKKTYHPICFEDHTDVSEGTPSPSVLSVTEPNFVSRKSLAYDEASQDGHHASFEEERKIVNEPMDTKPPSEHLPLNTLVKTEPSTDSKYVGTTKIKQEPLTEETSPDQIDSAKTSERTVSLEVVVKEEPGDETVVVKQELPDVLENVHESNENKPLQPVDEIKNEPVDNTSETETETCQVEESEKLEEKPMECSETAVLEREEAVKSEPDSDLESATPKAQKDITDTQVDPEIKAEDMTAEPDLETDSGSQTRTNTEISTSGLHVSSNTSHLVPPDDMEVGETQRSPTYSKLSKISLVIPPPTADISPEVLEIGSNASTPTQDELPSPPGEET